MKVSMMLAVLLTSLAFVSAPAFAKAEPNNKNMTPKTKSCKGKNCTKNKAKPTCKPNSKSPEQACR